MDIVFFALIAVVILAFLYRSLGKKVEDNADTFLQKYMHEKMGNITIAPSKKAPIPTEENPTFPDKNVQQTVQPFVHSDPEVAKGLASIRMRDTHFQEHSFLAGARKAFETILEAFTKGDKIALSGLVNQEVYHSFATAIDARDQEDTYYSAALVGIVSSEIIDAGVHQEHFARITVRFISEQMSTLRNKVGAIVAGVPTPIEKLEDIWVFGRSLREENVNWKLIATKGAS